MSVAVTREPSGLVRISRRVPPALAAAGTCALRFDLAEVRDFALAVKAGALDALLGLPLPETGPEPPSRRRGHPVPPVPRPTAPRPPRERSEARTEPS